MFARAIAEFEFTLIFADAPVDRFARGDRHAMTEAQKRGALAFFGKGRCSQCHSVGGESNEMFSDFRMHVIGVPQIAPEFGVGKGNVLFDGPPVRMRTSAWNKSPETPPIVTNSGPPRCEMPRCKRRSSTTAR
jgi:cytochrome c peroxidase